MVSDPQDLFADLTAASDGQPEVAHPNKSLDDSVIAIFDQAHDHRRLLILFYVWYTAVLSGLVMLLIFAQAAARFFVHGDAKIELVPQWALDLIVVGMFGQFIGLLTIVTKKVWEFKPFFDHARRSSGQDEKKDEG